MMTEITKSKSKEIFEKLGLERLNTVKWIKPFDLEKAKADRKKNTHRCFVEQKQ